MEILENTPTRAWPPVYTIRKSARARRVFLHMLPHKGLEIVIPTTRKYINVQKILNEQRPWIEKTQHQMQKHCFGSQPAAQAKPEDIICRALEETWPICYQPLPATKKITLIAHSIPKKMLLLKGNTENVALCHRILIRWLMQYAKLCLIPWLKALSKQTDLLYNKAIIRGQTTLWGSCNTRKTISLNYKLLFLPKSLAQYVLLHELCHTKYLNHSTQFWQYLQTWDAKCIEHKKMLKTAEPYLPPWL